MFFKKINFEKNCAKKVSLKKKHWKKTSFFSWKKPPGFLKKKRSLNVSNEKTFSEQICCRSYENAIPAAGMAFLYLRQPKTQKSWLTKVFFETYISFSNKMLRFFLKKTTPKFEGHWRKICDGPTVSTSNDISNTNKDCWQLDLPKTARSPCITPNHLHFPGKVLLICGNFSVHKNGKKFEYWS